MFAFHQFATGPLHVSCKQAKHSHVLPPDLRKRESKDSSENVEQAPDENPDKDFDWTYFWHLLKPQLHYFFGAIAVSLCVACLFDVHIFRICL